MGDAPTASTLLSGGGGSLTGGSKLKAQDLSKLDVTQLNPLSPEVISRQATINIGQCAGQRQERASGRRTWREHDAWRWRAHRALFE